MEMYINMITERIIDAMNERGWSLTTAADFCGVSRGEMGKILSGKNKDIRLSTIVKISQGIEKPLLYLIGENRNLEEGEELMVKLHKSIGDYLRKGGVAV